MAAYTYICVLLINTVMSLQVKASSPVGPNHPSCEEVTTAIAVNQITLLKMIGFGSGSFASNGMTEIEELREEAAARDARLQEVIEDLRATQETLKGMASLREELSAKMTSLEQQLATKVTSPEHQLATKVPSPACPDGWLCHESSLYLLDHTTRTWEDSLAYCRDRGGDLVKITSAEEQAFITGHLGIRNYWIGLNDRVTEGNFVWTDGTTPTYTRWGDRQPSDGYGSEDCVYMHRDHDYKWYDGICSPTGRSVVCERPVHP